MLVALLERPVHIPLTTSNSSLPFSSEQILIKLPQQLLHWSSFHQSLQYEIHKSDLSERPTYVQYLMHLSPEGWQIMVRNTNSVARLPGSNLQISHQETSCNLTGISDGTA